MDADHHTEAIDAFRDGYNTGVCDRVVEHCTTALPDPGADATGGRHPRRRAA
jgi:hypothetical protein